MHMTSGPGPREVVCCGQRGSARLATSPSLYNIFMDEFAERLKGVSREVADVPAVLFADDVLLTAKSATGLQELLDIASKWGEDRQMKWNVNAGKR